MRYYSLVLVSCVALLLLNGSPLVAAEESSPAEDEGWVQLIGDEGPAGFKIENNNITQCGDIELDAESKELKPSEGTGVIAVTNGNRSFKAGNLVSEQKFGDCELYLEFMIGNHSNSGIKLQERYEIQLYDSAASEHPKATECGGIYPHWVWREGGGPIKYTDEGYPPATNAAKPAGEWQTLRAVFRAPKFDAEGKKIENARMELVELNGEVVHENVELDSPTGCTINPLPEMAKAPLYLQLDHGPVAFRQVRVKPL